MGSDQRVLTKKRKEPGDANGNGDSMFVPLRKRTKKTRDLVKQVNDLPFEEFVSRYITKDIFDITIEAPKFQACPSSLSGPSSVGPGASVADSAAAQSLPAEAGRRERIISSPYCLKLYRSTNIPKRYFEACFSLVEYTSSETYRQSPDHGWNPRRKRDEMREQDMFFLLVLRQQTTNEKMRNGTSRRPGKDDEQADHGEVDEPEPPIRRRKRRRGAKDSAVPPQPPATVNLDDDLGGFTSFMVTYEAGIPVLYCYELHMHPAMQGRGTGELLMQILHKIGAEIPGLEKTMLTVFAENEGARRFYTRMGYEKDETCPTQMALKSGRTKEWSYLILSRSLQ